MMRRFILEKKFRRSGWIFAFLFFAFLLYACNTEPTPGTPVTQTLESTSAPTASFTPLPVTTSTSVSSLPGSVPQTATPEEAPFGEQLVDALRAGGYVIYFQSEESDVESQDLVNCPEYSDSDDHNHHDAQEMSATLDHLDIPIDRVLHSASCTALETATLMFGEAESWTTKGEDETLLRGERMSTLRRLLSTRLQSGANIVLVGHGQDITDVTGHEFVTGEIGIYKPLGEPGYSFVTQILPHELAELERNVTGQVRVEPYMTDALTLEQAEPSIESETLEQSRPGGQTALAPLSPFPALQSGLVLPDLVTLPPTDLRIRTNAVDGHRLLRFTNSIANAGPGKMELWGDTDPSSGKMTVTQYLYDTEEVRDKRVVGEFLFHPEHDHWHLGDFALYEILSVGLDGEPDFVVALSNKISYCLRDDERWDIPDAAVHQTYIICEHERQGISVGWIDVYRYHLPDQSIDITSLADGIYALRSTVNPESRLWETDLENNTAILYIEIEEDRVRILESKEVFNIPPENKD